MSPRTFLGFLSITTLTAAALAGCGSSGTATTGSGGSGGNGSSSSSSASSSGGGGGASSSSSSSSSTGSSSSSSGATGGGGAGGSGPMCSDFVKPAAPPPVTVHIVNKTGSDIFLGKTDPTDCDYNIGFTLEDANMNELKPGLGACEPTCGMLQSQGCACTPFCESKAVTLLAPNGYHNIPWPGTVFAPGSMPAKCYQEATCVAPTCLVESPAPAGPLKIKATGYSMAMGCLLCTCSPDQSTGTCGVGQATHVGGAKFEAEVTWNGETMVTVEFK